MVGGVVGREAKLIRGGYRRRLLDHLADGPATVSEAANAVGLRLPHASAELKRLRQEGFVASDSEVGQRGAQQHLTARGLQRINSDELARLKALGIDSIPRGVGVCLLARDGPQLLLAYAKQPVSPLIPVPQSATTVRSGGLASSTGTEGVKVEWIWAVARESAPRWYSIEELTPTSAPQSDLAPSSLEAWAEPRPAIGLVRARMLDQRQALRLPIGSWFSEPLEGEWPPLPSPQGSSESWRLGEAHPEVAPLRPQGPICAVLPERLSASIVLGGSAPDSWVVAEASLLGRRGDGMPFGALGPWIERAHPRLSSSERQRRLEGLKSAIRKGRRKRTGAKRVEESTWRRFQADWGKQDWVDSDGSAGTLVDVRGLSDTAWLSLIDWSLIRKSNAPAVIQHPLCDEEPRLLQRLVSDARTRMILLRDEPKVSLGQPILRPDPVQPLPWFRLQLAGDVSLPVHMAQKPPPALASPPPGWARPDNASEVSTSQEGAITSIAGDSPPDVEADSSEEMYLFAAVLRHSSGDAEWADRIESSNPVAAWIASPGEDRWSRWRRQSEVLGRKWLPLLDVEEVPIDALARVACDAPQAWQREAQQLLRQKLRGEADLALRLRPLIDSEAFSSAASAWLTAVLLSEVAWLGEALATDLSRWAVSRLAASPPNNLASGLDGLAWLQLQGHLREGWESELRDRRGAGFPTIDAWHSLLALVEDRRPLPNEVVSEVVSFPIEWWAGAAESILNQLIEDAEGRDLILHLAAPWPAAILRPPGESLFIPGLGERIHAGCSIRLMERLERLLNLVGTVADEGQIGYDSLMDLFEALSQASHEQLPLPGRSHPLVGWLAQPLENWPQFSVAEVMAGESHAAARIASRISGYHPNITSRAQRRL